MDTNPFVFSSDNPLRKVEEIPILIDKATNKWIQSFYEDAEKDFLSSVKKHNVYRIEFEKRLYYRWKTPFDLLDALIILSHEIAEQNLKKLKKNKREITIKYAALRKIHGRALLISGEILTLLKGGYPDGAYSRWRSLYEIEIISYFLQNQDDSTAKRFFEHADMKRYKNAIDFQKHCKEINYEPYNEDELNILKARSDELIKKYGGEFKYYNGYEWIPKSIIKDRNFKTLEEYVGFMHYRPYYNVASDSIHGGSSGFRTMGLIEEAQDKQILTGPTNYGLTDALHATAISLNRITLNLLTQYFGIEEYIHSKYSLLLVDKIGITSLQIQKKIKKEEMKLRRKKD